MRTPTESNRGHRPGTYNRNRTVPATFHRVSLPTGPDEPTFYWDRDRTLYDGEALTRPAGLVIVQLIGADPEDDED